MESDVVLHARATIADGVPRRLIHGSGSPWLDIRLLCGARMELLFERLASDDLAAGTLLDAFAQRRPAWWTSDGRTRQCSMDQPPPAPVQGVARLYKPACRLVVLGRDPTAMAIASLGAQSGMEVVLIRHLGPEADPMLAGVTYLRGAAPAALRSLAPDPWTAVAVANHDWQIDHVALIEALTCDAFYVGLLGTRRRSPGRLAADGLGKPALARLRAPIGIDFGGKAPWEIAVSVVAEVMSVWHHGEGDLASRPRAQARSPDAR